MKIMSKGHSRHGVIKNNPPKKETILGVQGNSEWSPQEEK